jgi:hypothetical protein
MVTQFPQPLVVASIKPPTCAFSPGLAVTWADPVEM